MTQITAPELVKAFGPRDLNLLDLGVLKQAVDEKGFDSRNISALAKGNYFGPMLAQLVLRTTQLDLEQINGYGAALPHLQPSDLPRYTGAHFQNARIDAALANSNSERNDVVFTGEGAATFFTTTLALPARILNTPIAVIGYGAAGILVTFALQTLGFRNVTVFERSRPLGVWSLENVYRRSRNNPRRLQFYDRVLHAAPGGGEEIRDFLLRLSRRNQPEAAFVSEIKPGNLKHVLHFSQGRPRSFPIVINAMGLGKPKPLSDPKRMTTSARSLDAGPRWQFDINAREAEGMRFIFIGLGNSTAEMLRQIHNLMDAGVDVDYRVLTHYPKDAVENPNSYVHSKGKLFRVFRDISTPNLVDFQGDLPESRHDYYRALHAGRIITDVRRWEVKDGVIAVYAGSRTKRTEEIAFDKIATLTGYRHPQETLEKMGITYDVEEQCGLFDYDGEFIANPRSRKAEQRLHQGYFGFGSVLETPRNPNAIVIPGMLHRIGDVLFGIIMRSVQHSRFV